MNKIEITSLKEKKEKRNHLKGMGKKSQRPIFNTSNFE